MFGHRFFGAAYFGPRYYGPGEAGAPPAGGGRRRNWKRFIAESLEALP